MNDSVRDASNRLPGILNGRHLRAARVLAGLTQAELAGACGFHTNSVRYWERKGHIESENVGAIAAIVAALRVRGVEVSSVADSYNAAVSINYRDDR